MVFDTIMVKCILTPGVDIPKIVSVRSSNSEYHSKWLYLYGWDVEFVRPCRKVTKATIDYLNGLEKYDVVYLESFLGSRAVYTHLELKDAKCLEGHHRKGCSLLAFLVN